MALYGANTFIGTLYMAALKASEQMAILAVRATARDLSCIVGVQPVASPLSISNFHGICFTKKPGRPVSGTNICAALGSQSTKLRQALLHCATALVHSSKMTQEVSQARGLRLGTVSHRLSFAVLFQVVDPQHDSNVVSNSTFIDCLLGVLHSFFHTFLEGLVKLGCTYGRNLKREF